MSAFDDSGYETDGSDSMPGLVWVASQPNSGSASHDEHPQGDLEEGVNANTSHNGDPFLNCSYSSHPTKVMLSPLAVLLLGVWILNLRAGVSPQTYYSSFKKTTNHDPEPVNYLEFDVADNDPLRGMQEWLRGSEAPEVDGAEAPAEAAEDKKN
ncbi:hypothetical protein C8R43DRAFT_1140751 [Mycena crocata]|nr:hypothetical protein C8R43DRAFT_1140751 [Mycena crocata]